MVQEKTNPSPKSLEYDLQAVVKKYTEDGHGSKCLPQLKDVSSNDDLIFKLIRAGTGSDNSEQARDAKKLLDLVYLTIQKDQTERLSGAIDKFNEASVSALSDKLQSFIDSLKNQADDAAKQTGEMLKESKWLGRYTAALAGFTFLLAVVTGWMAISTKTLADEAALNIKNDTSEHHQQVEKAMIDLANSGFSQILAAKDKEIASLKSELKKRNAPQLQPQAGQKQKR